MGLLKRFTQYLRPIQGSSEPFAISMSANEALTRQLAAFKVANETLTQALAASQAAIETLTEQLASAKAANEALAQQLADAQAAVAQREESQNQPSSIDPNVLPLVPKIPPEQQTPVVVRLLEIIQLLREQAQALKDEIARLKGLKARPKLRPSRLTGSARADGKDSPGDEGEKKKKARTGKRPGSEKRRKTAELKIHETVFLKPDNLPDGSRFKGYEDFTVQDIIIKPHNTLYRRERWVSSDGQTLMGRLPEHLKGGHFGTILVAFILYQHYHCHVTQPLLLEQLREFKIDISAGKLNQLLTEGKEDFHAEKEAVLAMGLAVSNYVHVDDTGARHQGNNGYCTHIGNELFAYFESTPSKNRINFLKLLRGPHTDYMLSEDAFDYMLKHKLPQGPQRKLEAFNQTSIADDSQWSAVLAQLDITNERHVRIATEGALVGSVLAHGVNEELAIISDDAGQFDVFKHGLCWIHAERTLAKLVGFNGAQREALEEIRTQVWEFYRELKDYKASPTDARKQKLGTRFDELMSTQTCFASLNQALKRLKRNRRELLLVLDRPEVALENNLSERDIREYVKKRKISGSTRSELGRRCRDTFTSLKKTGRKHGLSFWSYLKDRLFSYGRIPMLSELLRQRAEKSKAHGVKQLLTGSKAA